ncbi:NTP transferase domain-containing protein [Kaistella sp. G5-32]|uniref:Probable molybdenum cofactor guanylyltransferase n=1 Tax=Kaistella gelatinilytica TaxID=2787636 RepID=A0ABS0FB04_9FLAO|nr:NTP transferase domain-containing protein [Kaistella gelatinilytica]MBF8456842.1 NTP transferase domain-containing protein [Kaistella gelatinilytica]
MKEELNNKIYIFSDKIGSGKTTLLKNWFENNENISGFLSPKVNGKRVFENLETGEQRLLEVEHSSLQIGKYSFDPEVFSWAESELSKQLNSQKEWLIIDEIGPLEIRKEKGFHELILKILNDESSNYPKIVFVVRDFMVDEFIEKYQFQNPKILPKNFFVNSETKPNLLGITLCGGESKRMKTDKALLNYGDNAQWKKVSELLKPFCEEVVISINENQWQNWAEKESDQFIIDDQKFQDHGPISGILSVIEKYPDQGLMIVGTDFPFLKMEHLVQLNNERSPVDEAVCFDEDGFLQPLVSIIEKEATVKLKKFFEEGNDSLRKFLGEINTKKIKVEEGNFLNNINTEVDYLKLRND